MRRYWVLVPVKGTWNRIILDAYVGVCSFLSPHATGRGEWLPWFLHWRKHAWQRSGEHRLGVCPAQSALREELLIRSKNTAIPEKVLPKSMLFSLTS